MRVFRRAAIATKSNVVVERGSSNSVALLVCMSSQGSKPRL